MAPIIPKKKFKREQNVDPCDPAPPPPPPSTSAGESSGYNYKARKFPKRRVMLHLHSKVKGRKISQQVVKDRLMDPEENVEDRLMDPKENEPWSTKDDEKLIKAANRWEHQWGNVGCQLERGLPKHVIKGSFGWGETWFTVLNKEICLVYISLQC